MAADPQGLGLKAPLIKPGDLEDDPDRLFRDMTDWSVVDATGVARYRYNDRELHRAWADNAPKTRQFMMDNYVLSLSETQTRNVSTVQSAQDRHRMNPA